jgi:hypothetical protein
MFNMHIRCLQPFFFFFLVRPGIWTQGFTLAKQNPYCLSHASSPSRLF